MDPSYNLVYPININSNVVFTTKIANIVFPICTPGMDLRHDDEAASNLQAKLDCVEIESLTYSAANLRASYKDTMNRMEDAFTKGEYHLQLLADCVSLSGKIWKLALSIHQFIISHYKNRVSKFEPIDDNYLSLILRELRDYAGQLMNRRPSSELALLLQRTINACEEAVSLDADRKRIAFFGVAAMRSTAPNLSALVGTSVAAKLVISAGGIEALAKMDQNGVLSLGSDKNKCYVRGADICRAAGDVAGAEVARCVGSAALADWGGRDPTGGIGKLRAIEVLKILARKSKPLRELMKKKSERRARDAEMSELMNDMMSGGMECADRRAAAGTGKLGPKVAGKFKRQQRAN